MEGTRCNFKGCSVHDFLPLLCKYCSSNFCSEHSSVLAHECSLYEESVKPPVTEVKEYTNVGDMMKKVELRFQNDEQDYSNKTHFNIKKRIEEDDPTDKKKIDSKERIAKVLNSSIHGKSEKERKTSSIVRSMMIKTRAKGNENTHKDDRFYLAVHFEDLSLTTSNLSSAPPSSFDIEYLFFRKGLLVNELLHLIQSKFEPKILKHNPQFDSKKDTIYCTTIDFPKFEAIPKDLEVILAS